jgi:hypothetical protein
MTFIYTKNFDHNKINLLSSITDKGIRQWKTMCNPIQQAGSPTQQGSHIYMQVGCGHDGYLLHPSSHMSLAVDFVVEEPTSWKSATEKAHSYHTRKEESMDQTSRVHPSIEKIYTYPAWTRKQTCKCQITQYSYMQNFITHTFVRVAVFMMTVLGCLDCLTWASSWWSHLGMGKWGETGASGQLVFAYSFLSYDMSITNHTTNDNWYQKLQTRLSLAC